MSVESRCRRYVNPEVSMFSARHESIAVDNSGRSMMRNFQWHVECSRHQDTKGWVYDSEPLNPRRMFVRCGDVAVQGGDQRGPWRMKDELGAKN